MLFFALIFFTKGQKCAFSALQASIFRIFCSADDTRHSVTLRASEKECVRTVLTPAFFS